MSTAKQRRIFCPSLKTNKLSVQCATPCGKVLQQNEREEGFGVESAQIRTLLSQRHKMWHYCVPGNVKDPWRGKL